MESYSEIPAIWDLATSDSTHPSEQEFFDLLHKQFVPSLQPNTFPSFIDSVNPQNLSLFQLSNTTPSSTSEDSSPSPPTTHQDTPQDGNTDDPTLKRKATTDQLESEPSNKAQHTKSTDRRAPTGATSGTRRRSSGQTGRDEQRLLRRKEQNRAAQRAFRERKEKHVKDLEDKVAELEAKNDMAVHENDNLRDMLSRLQSENMTLKQSAFTFSVPKDATNTTDNTLPAHPVYPTVSPARSMSSSSTTLPSSPKPTNPLDWSSLTTFNPNVLNLLDDNIPQSTATDNAMRMDFGFGNTDLSPNPPFTVIANNPMFTTPAFDFLISGETNSMIGTGASFNNASSTTSDNRNAVDFDMNALPVWQSPTQSNVSIPDSSFDQLFRGYMSSLAPSDFMSFPGSTPSISPITHHTSPPMISNGSTSSPSILGSEPLFTRPTPSSATDADNHSPDPCTKPKSKEECREKIAQEGNSMFAPPIQKSQDQVPIIKCAGSSFPKTEKNDQNIEVLTAWKTIRSDPKFKDVDITELCHQFTKKACCDGTKVVLEPAAVSEIMDNLSKNRSQ